MKVKDLLWFINEETTMVYLTDANDGYEMLDVYSNTHDIAPKYLDYDVELINALGDNSIEVGCSGDADNYNDYYPAQ